jgi:neutral ceramidase
MKPIILLSAFLVAMCVPSPAAEEAALKLRAGASAVDVTPKEFPVNMPGLFTPRMVEKVHDPLHARALVLNDGTTTVALVVVDNLQVAQEAGIPRPLMQRAVL